MSKEHLRGAGTEGVCGLAAAYALGSLTQQEKAAFEDHLAKCPKCQAELQGASEALTDLTDSAPLSHDARAKFINKIHRSGRQQQSAAIDGTSAPSGNSS